MTETSEFAPGEIVEVGLESWAGRTWHRVEVVRGCMRRGKEHLEVIWRDQAAFSGRRVPGRTYFPPRHAVRKLTSVLVLVSLLGACASSPQGGDPRRLPPTTEQTVSIEAQRAGQRAIRRVFYEIERGVWRRVRGY